MEPKDNKEIRDFEEKILYLVGNNLYGISFHENTLIVYVKPKTPTDKLKQIPEKHNDYPVRVIKSVPITATI